MFLKYLHVHLFSLLEKQNAIEAAISEQARSSSVHEMDELQADIRGTYTLTWDNVQWQSEAHRQGSQDKNQFHLMSLYFAAMNRTDSLHFSVSTEKT
jgi:hypothetical protein